MFLLEYSSELLRLSAAIAILGVGVASTWFLIYLIKIVKRVYKTIRIFEVLIDKIDNYIAKPVAAIEGIVDDIAPIIRFFAGRHRQDRD